MNDIEKAIIGMRGLKELLPPLLLKFNYENLGKEDAIEVVEHLNLAITALEKQLPKRPHADDNGGCEYYECWIECPDCGEAIPEYTAENNTWCYCLGCGQKLDWEEENE